MIFNKRFKPVLRDKSVSYIKKKGFVVGDTIYPNDLGLKWYSKYRWGIVVGLCPNKVEVEVRWFYNFEAFKVMKYLINNKVGK